MVEKDVMDYSKQIVLVVYPLFWESKHRTVDLVFVVLNLTSFGVGVYSSFFSIVFNR